MAEKTRIYRSSNRENFTIINNEILRRKDVSWKAKGILAYIMALPIDWEIYLEELQTHATDGRDSFRTGWKELQDKGYVIRYPIKEKGKIIKWVTEVRETLDSADFSPQTEFPQVEKPQVGKPQVENPKLLSTYSTNNLSIPNTDNTNNKTYSPAEAEPRIPYKEIVDHLNKVVGSQYRHTTSKTQALIKARFKEGFDLEDFKQVVEIKAKQWKNDKEMAKYLRPETLFGTKFEGYLNESAAMPRETRIYEHQVTQEDIDEFNRLKAEGY